MECYFETQGVLCEMVSLLFYMVLKILLFCLFHRYIYGYIKNLRVTHHMYYYVYFVSQTIGSCRLLFLYYRYMNYSNNMMV